MTEDEVERIKGEVMNLSYRVVCVQCTKPPEVVTRTADVLHKYGYNDAVEAHSCVTCKQLTKTLGLKRPAVVD